MGEMKHDQKKILIVENEALFALSLRMHLMRLGYEVYDVLSSGEEAVERVAIETPDLIIMDINLTGEMSGIDAVEKIRSRYLMPVLFVTGYTDPKIVEQIENIESSTYIEKPFKSGEFGEAVANALKMETTNRY